MGKPRFSLRTKIMFFTSFIIIASIVFISVFFSFWAVNNLKDKIGVGNMNTAINIGNYPFLCNGDGSFCIFESTSRFYSMKEDRVQGT